METDLYRGFTEVATTGSFTGASERLPISQSGLSQQVKRLERQLGVTLLRRTSREVELTENGRILLPLLNKVIEADNALLQAARTVRSDPAPTSLRIAVAEDATGTLLVDLIDRTREILGSIKVEVVQVSIPAQAVALAEAPRSDALLERTPNSSTAPGERRTPLRAEPLAVVVPERHRGPDTLTVAEARRLELRPMQWLPREWIEWFPLFGGTDGDDVESTLVVTSFRSAIQSVALDRRACVAPVSIAETMADVACRVVPLTDAPQARLDLVTREDGIVTSTLHEIAESIAATNGLLAAPAL